MIEQTPSEILIIEFSDLTKEINKLKRRNASIWRSCESYGEDRNGKAITCISEEFACAREYNNALDFEECCTICYEVIGNSDKRKKLSIARGYTKNKIQNLSTRLKAVSNG